jgi:hypothetical protein
MQQTDRQYTASLMVWSIMLSLISANNVQAGDTRAKHSLLSMPPESFQQLMLNQHLSKQCGTSSAHD